VNAHVRSPESAKYDCLHVSMMVMCCGMQLKKAAEEAREQYRELSKVRNALKEEAVDKGACMLPSKHYYYACAHTSVLAEILRDLTDAPFMSPHVFLHACERPMTLMCSQCETLQRSGAIVRGALLNIWVLSDGEREGSGEGCLPLQEKIQIFFWASCGNLSDLPICFLF